MSAAPEPVIALAATPREWALRLHRHVADHGGARIRATVLTAAETLAERFDVLIADDRTSFLGARLVAELHQRGKTLLGLYDPEDPQAKGDLHDWGADQTLPCDTSVPDLLTAVVALARSTPPAPAPAAAPPPGSARLVVVGGPSGGVGRTETALTLAVALSEHGPTLLAETDEAGAGLAPRLGLPPYPNLRLALDLERRRPGAGAQALQPLSSTLGALVAGPLPTLLPAPPGDELTALVATASQEADWVVLETERPDLWLRRADAMVAVCAATPTGVLRAAAWLRRLDGSMPPPHLVLNLAPRSALRTWEAMEELGRARPLASITRLPHDERVPEAVWRGAPVRKGRFLRGVAGLAARLCDERALAEARP